MPRGRCEAAEYFKRDRASPTKSRGQYKCNACAAAYAADPRGAAPPKDIDNRKTTMENHLRRCDFTAKFIKDKFATKRKLVLIGGDSNASAAKIRVAEWSNDDQQTLESRLLEFQHQNLLPDGFIEKAATIRLLEFLRPGIASVLPSRRALGKRILIRHAKRCENDNKANLRERQLTTHGRVNFLSDVWKNIAKTHLLGCQLTLFGQVHTFDVVPVGSLHDGIAVARDLEGSLSSAVSQSWDVGSVVTDDAGQCKRARRVLALRWPRVAFLHCFAHDVNNLVKAVLNSSYRGVSDQASTAVNCMNGSSSKWLRRVRDVMSALQAFHASYRAALDFPASLQVLGDDVFWAKLAIADQIIRPLSLASYRLQRDTNTVADVVHSYGEIHCGFRQAIMDSDSLLACVNARWLACEQPLFLLGYFLHPIYKDRAIELANSKHWLRPLVSDFAVFYYRKFIGEDHDFLRTQVMLWLDGKLTRLTTGYKDCVPDFWLHVKDEGKADQLSKLALIVLSIAVNTAACERLFSEFGAIHSPTRNRLDPQKVKYIHMIRKSLRTQESEDADVPPEKRIVDVRQPDRVQNTPQKHRPNTSRDPPNTERRLDHGYDHSNDEEEDEIEEDDVGSADQEAETSMAPLDPLSFWDELMSEIYGDHPNELEEDESGEEEQFRDDMVNVDVDALEEIPPAKTGPLPLYNDKKYEQEKLSGLRAWTIDLAILF